jgi:hypothetical protein
MFTEEQRSRLLKLGGFPFMAANLTNIENANPNAKPWPRRLDPRFIEMCVNNYRTEVATL